MAGIVAGGGIQLGSAAKNLGRRRAAGIYGAIITAAILDTAGDHLPTAALVVSVVVTLLVYWLAEEYAALGHPLGGDARKPHRADAGSVRGRFRPGRRHVKIRAGCREAWPGQVPRTDDHGLGCGWVIFEAFAAEPSG
jgi:hypothetical protein